MSAKKEPEADAAAGLAPGAPKKAAKKKRPLANSLLDMRFVDEQEEKEGDYVYKETIWISKRKEE
jgi:hypothetical protein